MTREYRYLPDHDPELLELALALHRERPDLQRFAPVPDSLAYWRWINISGYCEYESLRRLLPAVPGSSRRDVVSVGGVTGFLDGGFATFAMLDGVLERRGKRFADLGRVLDFGCGCGRGIRMLAAHAAGGVELHGTDVDSDAIAWCRAHLPFARFHVNQVVPPLGLAAGSFDLVYTVGVIAHLAEENHLLWLEELRRVIRDSGLLMVTTHGPGALARFEADEQARDSFGLSPAQHARAQSDLQKRGFSFLENAGRPEGLNPELFGLAFVTEAYVREQWCRGFRLAEVRPCDVHDWLDVVVLEAC